MRTLFGTGLCLALLLTTLSPTLADDSPGASAASRASVIADLHRDGKLAEALAACRSYNHDYPGDPVMLYNQACLESRMGKTAAAVAGFRAAVAAGYDDLHFALADPDLKGAVGDSVRAVVGHERRRWAAESKARGAQLARGRSVQLPMSVPAAPADDPEAHTAAGITLTWVETGLEIRLKVSDPQGLFLPADGAGPWSGDGGLLVALGIPDTSSAGETSDSFLFGFARERGAGVGAVFVQDARQWQRVRELQPKIRDLGAGDFEMTATIPWKAIAPYHPLCDSVLGFNALLRARGGGPGKQVIASNDWDNPLAAHRRTVRLSFDLTTVTGEALQGRLSDTVIGDDPVALRLTAVSARAGEGTLRVDFRDIDGHSLLPDGPNVQVLALSAGVNAIAHGADFSQLRDGPCRIEAALELPSGQQVSWHANVLRLGPGWAEAYGLAIDALPADEQATARYHLGAIVQAAAVHRSRRDPGPMTTTLGDLNLMLARFRQTGSVVPEAGLSFFVYPGPDGTDRLCRLVLSPGGNPGAPFVPVVFAGCQPADGPRLASRLLRLTEDATTAADTNAAGDTRAVFVLPVLAPPAGGAADMQVELQTCVEWAAARFSAREVAISAQREGVAASLGAARALPRLVKRVLVFADGDLEPWPGANASALEAKLAPAAPDCDLSWIEFVQETALRGQGPLLLAGLRRTGWRLSTVDQVRGSPNFTQIADRTRAWIVAP